MKKWIILLVLLASLTSCSVKKNSTTTTNSVKETTQAVSNEALEQKGTDLVETINTAIEEDQEVVIEQFDTEKRDSLGNVPLKTRVTITKNKKTNQKARKEKSDSLITQEKTTIATEQMTTNEVKTDEQQEVEAESPLTKIAVIVVAVVIGILALIYIKFKK